jgi:DNA-binding transcriptional ArsR family regulator
MGAKLAKSEQKRVEREQLIHKALGYPLRHTIFTIISERVASPVEISREIGEPVSNISHHMRVLVKLGFAEEVGSQPRRGATEHFYRAIAKPWIDTSDWDAMPEGARKSFLGEVVERYLSDVSSALSAGTIGHDSNFSLVRDLHSYDEEGYSTARGLLEETLHGLLKIEEESTDRRAETGEEPVRASIGLTCFRLPPSV